MKNARYLLLALCMTAGFAASAQTVDPKVQRCTAKLHSCFQEGDLTKVFPTRPETTLDCEIACQSADGNPNACSKEECTDRCSVSFGLTPPPCE